MVRKVAGEVNPADLFTKHLPSKDKIHQLTALFGCEYREGRSATAPLLRPNIGQQDGHLSDVENGDDPLPHFVIREAKVHDGNMLPHQYEKKEIEDMFPMITAPEGIINDDDWSPGDNDGEWNDSGRQRGQEGARSRRRQSGPD